MRSRTNRKMAIIVTGEPVSRALAARGSFAQMIRRTVGNRWPGEWQEVDARDGEGFPEPCELDGLVITGSSASLTEPAPWMQKTEEYLRRVFDEATPIFGICFGHQLLGEALGGKVELNPLGRQIGTVELELTADDPLAGAKTRPFLVNTTHRDVVSELPPGARVLGRTPRDPRAFVRFSQQVWGVQFHPEFDAVTLSGYIQERREILAAEGFDVDALLERLDDASSSSEMLARFVEHCAKR